jgi:hypothetical protein
MKNRKIIGIVVSLAVITLSGCNTDLTPVPVKDDNGVTVKFKGGVYSRVNIDGVDCILAAGNFNATVAVTCDWSNKKKLNSP